MITQEILQAMLDRARGSNETTEDAEDSLALASIGASSGIPAPSLEMIEGAGRSVADSWMSMPADAHIQAQRDLRRANPTLYAVAMQHWNIMTASMGPFTAREVGISSSPYGVTETVSGTISQQIRNATAYSAPVTRMPEPTQTNTSDSILQQLSRGVVSRQTAMDPLGFPSNAYSSELLEQQRMAEVEQQRQSGRGILSPVGRGLLGQDLQPVRGWQTYQAPEPIVFSLRIPDHAGDMFGMFARNERQEVVSLYGIRVKIIGATVTSEDHSNVDVYILDQARRPICELTPYLAEAFRVFGTAVQGVVGVTTSALRAAVENPVHSLVGARAISSPGTLDVPALLRELAAAGVTQEEVQEIIATRGVSGLVERRDAQTAKRDAPAPHTRIGRKVVVL